MNLNGRVALVTGSSRGIGKSIALTLAARGCRVIVHGSRNSDALQAALAEVRAISPASISKIAELADGAAIRALFSDLDRLDILVNNAATQSPGAFCDLPEADWDRVLDVNLKAPFLLAQQAARLMQQGGRGGKIINISSVHAYAPRRNYPHYSSAKGGLETLTRSMALELAPFNIQVNSVVAGAIDTELTPGDRQDKITSAIPAGRVGSPEEIARLVAFLSSNECDYLTGASITADGGLTLGFCASRPDL